MNGASDRHEIDGLLDDMAPFVRSITGDGVRATLDVVRRHVPIDVIEVPTATPIFDWVVPEEWNVRAAYIEDPTGRRIVDMAANALHLVSYSEPVDRVMPLVELRGHLHAVADHPDWIPYRTSYWNRTWGFCLTQTQLDGLAEGDYHVVIDSDFRTGSLTYGELVIAGRTDEEIVVSTHTCHPQMVNDNLSGIAALALLGRRLAASGPLHHTVRLLLLPGTVGALSWLATHGDVVPRIRGGLVVTGLGDASPLTLKASRRGNSRFDRVARRIVRRHDGQARLRDWDPYGYDERQFCAPGFDLPFVRLTRGVHGTYPEYHTSADNRRFTSTAQIGRALDAMEDVIRSFDGDEVLVNRQPQGEPQLGRRGLYRAVGGAVDAKSVEMAYLWVLSLADGDHSIDDVVEIAGLDRAVVDEAIRRLADSDLVTGAR